MKAAMSWFVVFGLCGIFVGTTASNLQFKASMMQSSNITVPGMNIVMEMKGKIAYDGIFQRVKMDIKDIKQKMNMGGFGGGGMDFGGGGGMDFGGGGSLDGGGGMDFGGGGSLDGGGGMDFGGGGSLGGGGGSLGGGGDSLGGGGDSLGGGGDSLGGGSLGGGDYTAGQLGVGSQDNFFGEDTDISKGPSYESLGRPDEDADPFAAMEDFINGRRRRAQFEGSGGPPPGAVMLIRFDLGKNFTWSPGGGGCVCGDQTDPFTPLQVPEEATSAGETTITQIQGDKTVDVKVTLNSLDMSGFGQLDFYLDGNDNLVRAVTSLSFGGEFGTVDTFDFWDIDSTSVVADDFKPDASCKCKEVVAPKIATAPPPQTCAKSDKCKCIDASNELVFCKNHVKYPVGKATVTKAMDDLVKLSFEASTYNTDTETCKSAYEKFMCELHFQQCNAEGELLLPTAFDQDANGCTGPVDTTVVVYLEVEQINTAMKAAPEPVPAAAPAVAPAAAPASNPGPQPEAAPSDVNCVVTFSKCTKKCEKATARSSSVVVAKSGNGRPCPVAGDCLAGEGQCPAMESKSKFTASVRNSFEDNIDLGGGTKIETGGSFKGTVHYDGIFRKVKLAIKQVTMSMKMPMRRRMQDGGSFESMGYPEDSDSSSSGPSYESLGRPEDRDSSSSGPSYESLGRPEDNDSGGESPGTGAVANSGGGFGGGGGFESGSSGGFGEGGMSVGDGGISIDEKVEVDMVMLLRWDIMKNFTWITEGGKTTCECVDLVGPFKPMQIPAGAIGGSEVVIKQKQDDDDKEIEVKTTEKKMLLPGFHGFVKFYADKDESLRRQSSEFKEDMGGGMSMDTSETFDFWDVKYKYSDSEFNAHESCFCSKKKDKNGKEVAAVAAKISEVPPPKTCDAGGSCKCVKEAGSAEGLSFCKDIVTYPVNKVLFPKDTDTFVQAAYTGSPIIAGESENCKSSYKNFLCQFYFQVCKDGELSYPKAFDYEKSGCGSSPIQRQDTTLSFYKTVDNLNEGLNADGVDTSGSKVVKMKEYTLVSTVVFAKPLSASAQTTVKTTYCDTVKSKLLSAKAKEGTTCTITETGGRRRLLATSYTLTSVTSVEEDEPVNLGDNVAASIRTTFVAAAAVKQANGDTAPQMAVAKVETKKTKETQTSPQLKFSGAQSAQPYWMAGFIVTAVAMKF